jgi:hypothetical protein
MTKSKDEIQLVFSAKSAANECSDFNSLLRQNQPQHGEKNTPANPLPGISPRWGLTRAFVPYPGLAPWAVESRPLGASN